MEIVNIEDGMRYPNEEEVAIIRKITEHENIMNGNLSKFWFLKNLLGQCGCKNCRNKNRKKTVKKMGFETREEKNMATYLSSFCKEHGDEKKKAIDIHTEMCQHLENTIKDRKLKSNSLCE